MTLVPYAKVAMAAIGTVHADSPAPYKAAILKAYKNYDAGHERRQLRHR